MDDSPPAAFRLENPVAEGQAAAAAFYGVTVRTVKNWVAAGRRENQPCPLRSPAAMADWWSRVFTKAVPDCIHAAVKKAAAAPGPAAPSDPAPSSPVPALNTRLPLDLSSFSPDNFDASLQSARRILAAQLHTLEQLYLDPHADERRLRQVQAEWREMSDTVRKLEKDSGKIMEGQGLTYRASEIRAAIIEAHQFIPARFKSALQRLFDTLAALSDSELLALFRDPAQRHALADRTADEACTALAKTDLMERAA